MISLLPQVLRFNTVNRLLNVTVTQRRGTSTVRLPVMGGIGLDNLVPHEQWLDRIISALLARREGGAFIDVGVNVGQTMLKVKQHAPTVDYVGFEPNPVCYVYARRLIATNQFQNCTIIPVGLSNTRRVAQMYSRAGADDVSASIVKGFRPPQHYSQIQYVPVMRADDVLEEIGVRHTAVLKIDVEGAELEVIEGARQTLASRPFVICEILPLFSETGPKGLFRKPRQDKLLAVMREAGYVLFRVLPDATIVRLEDIEVHRDMGLTNYIFAPNEDVEWLEAALRQK
jgi:FkbM family methyltransferase